MKLTEIVLYRPGSRSPSLQLTQRWDPAQRWENTALQNLTGWADDRVRTVQITLGIFHAPLQFEVRRFVPQPGDVLDRFWMDGATRKSKRLEPYGFADVKKAADSYQKYISDYAFSALGMELATRDSDPLIKETYLWAYRRYLLLRVSNAAWPARETRASIANDGAARIWRERVGRVPILGSVLPLVVRY